MRLRSSRARISAAFAVLVLAFSALGLWQWMSPVSASPPALDTNINDYVLFAQHSIQFKGGDSTHGPAKITGGNVGVNLAGGTAEICSNHSTEMDPGSQFVSDNARLTSLCKLYNVFVNTITGGGGFVPQSPPIQTWTPPIIAAFPPLPPNNCAGGSDFLVPTGGSATITPGKYNNIVVNNGGSLDIQPGDYFICGDFHTGKNVNVTTHAGTTFNVAGAVNIGNQSNLGDAPDFTINQSGNTTSTLGKSSHIVMHLVAPNATVLLGDGNDLHGSFWADTLVADKNTDVTGNKQLCV